MDTAGGKILKIFLKYIFHYIDPWNLLIFNKRREILFSLMKISNCCSPFFGSINSLSPQIDLTNAFSKNSKKTIRKREFENFLFQSLWNVKNSIFSNLIQGDIPSNFIKESSVIWRERFWLVYILNAAKFDKTRLWSPIGKDRKDIEALWNALTNNKPNSR